jgi:phosphatidylglycerol:prolipoprotein diacylglycerol transferase
MVQIGPFTLYAFGLMVVVGFMAGIYLASRLARQRGLPGEVLLDGAVVILFTSIAGARLLWVSQNWSQFAGKWWEIIATWHGGMSFHGGAIAGVVTGLSFMRLRKVPALSMGDAAGPGLALGYAIGRLGCFMNGCCYGVPTELPWGVHFDASGPGVRSHPVQLYALAINLVLTALLVRAYRRPHRTGQVLALFAIGYSVYRFLIESLRKGVTADVLFMDLTTAQVFSVLAATAAGIWWVWLKKHGGTPPELVVAGVPVAGPTEPVRP